jgi:hypothetical protein
MKAIDEAIARLENERAAFNARIDGRIEGLREAQRLQSGTPLPTEILVQPRVRSRRGDLKETVLSLAQEAAEKGLTTESCVAAAKARGVDLIQASVSSLLSRLKNDGVMFFDGQVYRLKQYAGPRQAA